MQFGLPWPGAEVACEAEEAGVSYFCSGEFVDHEAYSTLADMVAGTQRATVGPGIAYAFARTPYAHAAAIRSMWKIAPDRLFLGLGSGAFTINRDWFGVEADHPVERMSDMIGAVRTWLYAENGEPVVYDGEYFKINAKVGAPVLGRIDAPILLAGFNKRMAAASARVGDGVIGHGLFTGSWWDEIVRPAMVRGASQSERDAKAVEHGWVITSINDDDPERAVEDARRMIAFYLTVKTYDPFVEHHGWQQQVDTIRTAFKTGDTNGMGQAVTDDMLEAIAVCGTTSDGLSALKRRGDSLAKDVAYLAAPSFLVGNRRRVAYARASLGLIKSMTETGKG